MAVEPDNTPDDVCETCDNQKRFCRALHRYKPSLECPLAAACDQTASGQPCMPCAEIAALDQEIEETENRLRDLAYKRIALKQKVNENHDTLTTRLHPDVIGEIFNHYVHIPEYHPGRIYQRKDPSDILSPLTLAAVCTAWRSAAFSAPGLWTSIYIYLPQHKSSPDTMTVVESWLGRAGSVPLSVTAISNPVDTRPSVDDLSDFGPFYAARKYAPSWKELTIVASPSIYNQFSGNGRDPHWQWNATTLKILRLFDRGTSLSRGDGTFRIRNTPSLTHLELQIDSLNHVDIEWHTITNIDASYLAAYDVLKALRLAQQLVHCKLSSVFSISHHSLIPSSAITHFALQDLDLCPVYSFPEHVQDMSSFFDNLRPTGLTSFKYHWNATIEPTESTAFLSEKYSSFFRFVSFLGNHLTQLIIERLNFTNQAFNLLVVQMLKTLPRLVQLSLTASRSASRTGCQMTEAGFPLIEALEYGRHDRWMFLPNLEELELSYGAGGAFSWAAFCKIFSPDLAAELEHCTSNILDPGVNGRPLQRIVLRFQDELTKLLCRSEAEHKRLVAVKNAGIDLEIYMMIPKKSWDDEKEIWKSIFE